MGSFPAATKGKDYGWGHFYVATKGEDYSWDYFLAATIKVPMDTIR